MEQKWKNPSHHLQSSHGLQVWRTETFYLNKKKKKLQSENLKNRVFKKKIKLERILEEEDEDDHEMVYPILKESFYEELDEENLVEIGIGIGKNGSITEQGSCSKSADDDHEANLIINGDIKPVGESKTIIPTIDEEFKDFFSVFLDP